VLHKLFLSTIIANIINKKNQKHEKNISPYFTPKPVSFSYFGWLR
jgi:hypothetical protein